MRTIDFHPEADNPRCIVCKEHIDTGKNIPEHHLNAVQSDNRAKNLVAYCSESCHKQIHNGISERGLLLWRKLDTPSPRSLTRIGHGQLSQNHKRLYRLDVAIERAYDEAEENFDPNNGRPRPGIDHSFWFGDIDGRKDFMHRFRSELVSYNPTGNTYFHRTRPVQVTDNTETGYTLRLPKIDDMNAPPESTKLAYQKFRNTLLGEQTLSTFTGKLKERAVCKNGRTGSQSR